jgi:hypothetical protein
MDIAQKYDAWKPAVIGIGLDVDKSYGNQCVDVDLAWGMYLFPGVAWAVLFPPVGDLGAKHMWDLVNEKYFEKIPNNPNDLNQLPQKGDIAYFGASPEAGYTSQYKNPDGHTGVVDHATSNYVWLTQQDGSEAQSVVQVKQRPWRYTRCLGWARPRLSAVVAEPASSGPVNHPVIGHDVWLKPPATNVQNGWSVYRRGQFPDRAKRIGALRPDWYRHGPGGEPGLVYRIEGVSQYANVVSITSDTYGPVDIYLDGDAQIL